MKRFKALFLGENDSAGMRAVEDSLQRNVKDYEILKPGSISRKELWRKWLFEHSEACILVTESLERLKKKRLWTLFLCLGNASRKMLIDGSEAAVEVSVARKFFSTIALLLVELLVSGLSWCAFSLFLPVYKLYIKLSPKRGAFTNEKKRVVFLRTNFWFDLKFGGSVSHTKGVADALSALGHEVEFISSDRLANIKQKTCLIEPNGFFSQSPNLRKLFYNYTFYKKAKEILEKNVPAFLYHRHDELTFSNVLLARNLGIPLILEFNSSETWKKKHWGGKRYLWFHRQCEEIALHGASHIVTVSEENRQNLQKWYRIKPEKITMNPNGVDPQLFKPDPRSGDEVRRRHGIQDKVVVGFVGTFGVWHGVEVLASIMEDVIKENPKIHFLWVGDGIYKKKVIENIEKCHLQENVTLVGPVEHLEIPSFLNACDILASPHTPQVDGDEFFGSPTKLFEYMAVGKAIIASSLGQIGQVLEHMKDAFLVEPGSKAELKKGILVLSENSSLRSFLGTNARAKALKMYSWKANACRVLAAFHSLR